MSELIVVCQTCGQKIEAGHLGIDTALLAAYRAAMEEWETNHPDGADLMDLVIGGPELVRWATHCEDCEPNTCGYCIEVAQLRTYKDLVKWTAHLMEKTWLGDTDWRILLQDVAAGQDQRVREVAK